MDDTDTSDASSGQFSNDDTPSCFDPPLPSTVLSPSPCPSLRPTLTAPQSYSAPPPPISRAMGDINTSRKVSIRTLSCTHPGCGKFFKRQCDLNKHAIHHKPGPYKCRDPYCSHTDGFVYHKDLTRHVNGVHGGQFQRFYCPDPSCKYAQAEGSGFTRRDNFIRHQRRKHGMVLDGNQRNGRLPTS